MMTAILTTGLAMGESPRWHDRRLWLSDWGAQTIITVDPDGKTAVEVGTPFELPFCIDWRHDGRLLVVAGREGLLLRREHDGSLVTEADLRGVSSAGWNEIVVDGHEHIYVNGGPGIIALVTRDHPARAVADGLTAFDIAPDGGLSRRRVWADLGDGVPDGICIDAEGAVWYADVPNRRCVRVREGGEVLQTINLDRGCFACMLGGGNSKTLFIIATEWQGMAKIPEVARARTGQVLTVDAPAPHAGWP